MLLAAIGPIEGHASALEAALKHLAEEGLRVVVHSGNSVAGGTAPAAVLDLLERHRVVCALGESDRLVARFRTKGAALRRRSDSATIAAIESAYRQLSARQLEALGQRPRIATLHYEGIELAACYGMPDSTRYGLESDTPRTRLERARESTPTDILIAGSEGPFYATWTAGQLMVNPGSLTQHPNAATYALLDTDADPWTAEAVRVPL